MVLVERNPGRFWLGLLLKTKPMDKFKEAAIDLYPYEKNSYGEYNRADLLREGFLSAKDYLSNQSDAELKDFLDCVDEERKRFSKAASETFWYNIGVNRVAFEDILIMYDQMRERLSNLSVEANEKVNPWDEYFTNTQPLPEPPIK